jgi:hypothetical protein
VDSLLQCHSLCYLFHSITHLRKYSGVIVRTFNLNGVASLWHFTIVVTVPQMSIEETKAVRLLSWVVAKLPSADIYDGNDNDDDDQPQEDDEMEMDSQKETTREYMDKSPPLRDTNDEKVGNSYASSISEIEDEGAVSEAEEENAPLFDNESWMDRNNNDGMDDVDLCQQKDEPDRPL